MGFTPLGYDHIVLHVRDQLASTRFYVDKLHCTLEHINEKLNIVHLRFGEQMLDLVPGDGPGAPGRTGQDHFCFSILCDDLEALRTELVAEGLDVDADIRPRRGAYGIGPSLYLRDLDGYSVELKPRPAA